MYYLMDFKEEVAGLLEEILRIKKGEIMDLLERPPSSELGDLALPCFSFSKKLKKSPDEIAKELESKLKPKGDIAEIRATGPYLNFFIKSGKITGEVMNKILKKVGYSQQKKKKDNIMVEFCSPNTNKPLHLGHLRNIFIGDSMSRIFSFLGYSVVRSSLINDRGIHICKSMLAYQKWGNNRLPDKKSDHFVGDFYVLFSKKAAEFPELEKEAHEMLRKWEENDREVREIWKKMNQWVYKGFEQTYRKIGVSFDRLYYESDIYDNGKEIVMDGFRKGVFRMEDGAIFAPLEKFNIPNRFLVRSDGTTLYITQDIYLAIKKFEDYNLSKSIYVVGSEQNLHFQQLFAILEMLGYEAVKRCHHLSYGMVYLPSGRMKSREGTVVDADELIAEMERLAAAEIKRRYSYLYESEIERRSHIIAVAALKFFMLKIDSHKDMTYNPEESISFEGETGPYLLYTYARISSIFRKGSEEGLCEEEGDADYSVLKEKLETEIIKELARFPEIVQGAAENYRPNQIAVYLIRIAQLFNEFYHQYPVLKAEEKVRDARLGLAKAVQNVIKTGLNLMGIDVLEQM